MTAKNHTITYGDAPANNGVGYSGFQNNETGSVLGGTLTYAYDYEQYGNVGNSYTITPSGLTSGNYIIQFVPGTLKVESKSVTPSLTGAVSKVYDGGTSVTGATTNTLGIALGGVVNNDDVSAAIGSAAYGRATVGTGIPVTVSGVALTGAKAGNYTLSADTVSANVGEITQRPVTVTASDQTVELNDGIVTDLSANPVPTTITGAVDGHTLKSITLTPSSTAAVTTAGTIEPSDVVIQDADKNEVTDSYTITPANGVLTVTPGHLIIDAYPTASAVTYGQPLSDSALNGGVVKFQNSDVEGTFAWKTPPRSPKWRTATKLPIQLCLHRTIRSTSVSLNAT